MEEHEDLKTRFEALSKGAYFEVLVPRSSDFDALGVLSNGSPEDLAKAPTRRNLFFDEKARLQLVLKTPSGEKEVRELLPGLQIVLAAHATDAVPQGGGNAASASGKQDLTTVTISAAESAKLLRVGQQTYVVWTPTLHIPWPRARLQRPAIYFTANLLMSPETTDQHAKPQTDHLTPYEPLPANVLEPLNFDPAFRGKKIYLSEDRITKVAPSGARTKLNEQVVKPIRGASKRAFPTMPALFTRMKYSAIPDGTVVSLHIESSQVIAGIFDVKCISVHSTRPVDSSTALARVGDGSGTSTTADSMLQNLTDVTFPVQMQAGDETVLLYHLKSQNVDNAAPSQTTLCVAIQATAALEQGSQIDLDIAFQSQVSPGKSAPERTYNWARPLSASSSQKPRQSTQSDPQPASIVGAGKHENVGSGVTFYLTAPRSTHQGQDMPLNIKCINKSSKPRRFAVLPLHRRSMQATPPAHSSMDDADLVAGIFSAPILQREKAADVFCDTPDVRIGPVPPGACFETEMNFHVVLASGVLDLGTISIVDLDTKQRVDVTELPDVIALEGIESGEPYIRRGTIPRRNDKVTKQMDAARQRWHRKTAEWMDRKALRTGDDAIP
ncbi:hypothetical protein LTR85_006246 [Meristemomyces frigidus]|nr:hypothetical protein LTR85_006246 [Meristemomyces frigidus]